MARSKVRTTAVAALTATGAAAWFRRRLRVNEPASKDGHAAGHRHLTPSPDITSGSLDHRAERRWTQAKRRLSGRTP